MSFRFFQPRSAREALALLAAHEGEAHPVAGGTDLTLRLRSGAVPRAHLVGLAAAGLDGVDVRDGHLRIGATTTLRTLREHPELRRRLPHLAAACGQIGGPQIQEIATLGGNLGNASPAADSAPPLLVEDAVVRLSDTSGSRELPLADFFRGPGRTVRRPTELVVAILVPAAPLAGGRRVRRYFRKYGPRRANVVSAVTFAARIEREGERVARAAFALGSVAPTPVRARRTEALLAGRRLAPSLLSAPELVAAIEADVAPIDDVRGSAAYKTLLAVNSVRWALWRAIEEG